MTRLFAAGAEAASIGVFNGPTTDCAVSTVQKRTGAYSFRFFDNNRASQVLAAAISEFYLRLGIYPTAHQTGGCILYAIDSAAANQFSLTINVSTGLIALHGGFRNVPWATGTHPIALNAWRCIEVWAKIDNDVGDGRVKVLIDGETDIDYTGDTQYTANANVQRIQFMRGDDYNRTIGYVDDIAINDTAGAINNSWIGRGGIYPVFPEGVGNYTDLHAFGGGGNAWDCINEVPPDDADYVYDDTVDQKSTYALTDLVPTTGTIACINVIMRAKLDAAGAGNIARLIRSNGVDSQGADVGLDVSAKTIQDIIETDPGAAPGTLWTIARVNALEAGAVVR